jgi:hypothetical protein
MKGNTVFFKCFLPEKACFEIPFPDIPEIVPESAFSVC